MKIHRLALASLSLLMACSTADCKYDRSTNKTEPGKTAVSEKTAPKKTPKVPTVMVYKADGSKQCDMGKGRGVAEMEKSELGGIEVFSRQKSKDGLMHIQMCGADTGWVNIYEVPEKELATLLRKGFKKWPPAQ